ncbi:hypothetical protein B296_00033098 [Ensete ventricosum]|uniref:Uncharacterized protein n=1 Tax=Ensete ventricosum TaxID=4639 RepID=A0A426YH72_ENSVE|nr:hypothetical protein B296_00033098 [Ensete ventricosum]
MKASMEVPDLDIKTRRTHEKKEGAGSEGTSMVGRGGQTATAEEAEVALVLLHYERRRWRCRKKCKKLSLDSGGLPLAEER